jgi:uncharacterized membrane protein YdjX (TVP38/TMEM64 family)
MTTPSAPPESPPAVTQPAPPPDPPPDPPPEETLASILRKLGPAGVLGAIWGSVPAIVGSTMLVYLKTVSEWIQGFGARAVAVYVALFVITAGIGLLPTYTQALLAGWCFGLSTGFAAALGGFVGASLVGYAIARTVARHRVEDTINENPKAAAVRDSLIGHGWAKTITIVTLLRVPPTSPFALTNLVMSSTGVPLWIYTVGTLVGMAPRTFLAVYIGNTLRLGMHELTKDEIAHAAPRWVTYAGIGVALGVFAIIGVIAKQALEKVTARPPTSP